MTPNGKAKVYFTKNITPQAVTEVYRALGIALPGKVAVKVHSGEQGNQNYLHPEFMQPMVELVKGTVVECNTAYGGARNTTAKHRKLIAEHGWDSIFDFDLMDANGPDAVLEIPDGKIIKENFVGKHLLSYDSLLVLSHFKGHPMGGYGGALKQLSIGCASSAGKAWIHSGGGQKSQVGLWSHCCEQDAFLESMADAAGSVVRLFEGRAAYVNIMANISVDCDCCGVAEDPCMADIGILSSLDPVAIDRACMDLVIASKDPGREHFLERVNSRHGTHTIDAAVEQGCGVTEYELICLD